MRVSRSLSVFASLIGISAALGPNVAPVYLLPANPTQHSEPPRLNHYDANTILSHHLGLGAYEEARDGAESLLNEVGSRLKSGNIGVGQGAQDSVLVIIESNRPEDVIPLSIRPTFSIDDPPPASMFSDLIHVYTDRAHRDGCSVFSVDSTAVLSPGALGLKAVTDAFTLTASAAGETLFKGMQALLQYADKKAEEDKSAKAKNRKKSFATFELLGLADVQSKAGGNRLLYEQLTTVIRGVLQSPALQDRNVAVIVVPPESALKRHARRQQQTQPVSPLATSGVVFAVSTCFATNDTCQAKTDACSGHGACVASTRAGRTCYTCSCAVTKNSEGRRQWWAGQSCEKLDLSTSFTLLAGSTIFLVALVLFSVGLLYSIGSESLPNTLAAGAVPHHVKRD